MLADFIEAEPAGFLFRVTSAGSQGREMVVAVYLRRVIQVTNARRVRCANQGVKRERGRSVAARQPFDERAGGRWVMRKAHGFLGAGGSGGTIDFGNGFWLGPGFGVVPALARRDALSARGSI